MPPSPNRPLAEILTDLSTLLQIRQKLQQKDEAHLVLSLPWTDSLLLSTLTSLSDSLPSPSPPQALQNLHQMLDIEDTLNKMELHDMVNQLQIVMIQQKTCLESADKVNDQQQQMEVPETPQGVRREESVELVSARGLSPRVASKEIPSMRMTRSRARRAARSRGLVTRGGRVGK